MHTGRSNHTGHHILDTLGRRHRIRVIRRTRPVVERHRGRHQRREASVEKGDAVDGDRAGVEPHAHGGRPGGESRRIDPVSGHHVVDPGPLAVSLCPGAELATLRDDGDAALGLKPQIGLGRVQGLASATLGEVDAGEALRVVVPGHQHVLVVLASAREQAVFRGAVAGHGLRLDYQRPLVEPLDRQLQIAPRTLVRGCVEHSCGSVDRQRRYRFPVARGDRVLV